MSNPDITDGTARSPVLRGSSEEFIEHAQYYVMHVEGQLPIGEPVGEGRLLYSAPMASEAGGVFVSTGTMFGPVLITVEIYDSAELAVADTGDWEIVEEVGVVAKGTDLQIVTEVLVETSLPRLPLVAGEAAGVRIHARGYREGARLQEITGPGSDAVEHHLLQLWRA